MYTFINFSNYIVDPDLCDNEMKENIYSHTQIYGNKHSDTVNSYSIK